MNLQRSGTPAPGGTKAGLTLLELLIAMSCLVVILGGVMSFYISGIDAYETGRAYAAAEMLLQIKMGEIMDELAETGETALTMYTYIDPLFVPATDTQQAICFPSARDAGGAFIIGDGSPIWQSVVVIAPFVENDRGQIRRYESFGNYAFPITITNITATQIDLTNGMSFNRDSGRMILGNLARLETKAMKIKAEVNPVSITLSAKIYLPKGDTRIINIQSFVNCRNPTYGVGGLYNFNIVFGE